MPDHVRSGLITQLAFGVPALAMIPSDDLIEAIKCLKSYVKPSAKKVETDRGFDLLIAAIRMIVALWTELVDDRKGLDGDALWQRAADAAEQVKANLAANLAEMQGSLAAMADQLRRQ